MKICGACERELSDDSFSEEERGRRQSSRRCEECVAAGNQLVLMKKGLARSEEDECPICNLPLPLDDNELPSQACCLKRLCHGCNFSAVKRGMWDCPFCRTPTPETDSQVLAMIQKRVDAGDPMAIWNLGSNYRFGEGVEKDVTRAVELYERAAELGVKEAHHNLGVLYDKGADVQENTDKAFRHYEAAAMRGHVPARFNLGCMEFRAENDDLALQHWMIAANLGYQDALNNVKGMFMKGVATKVEYTEALRGYQCAVDEMRSPERDDAKRLRH
ncbi:hypothetical protein THAOC_33335 [Thalassiosira oceanica]|uniref:RING-type domain-containing protein n=1 Tax=Thalassiosira oceanica TaxID=159749 RepID=K0RMF3_THAOC|nr:hypothetical protein THAOC_33335 [Thalassiosira oceanica]|eukprot:EJK47912.1 hypothetical protein THAOC_33335 [Thalassiosira oceanica]